MYARAPRVLRLAEGGNIEDPVGPGSYQVPFLKQQATVDQGFPPRICSPEGIGLSCSDFMSGRDNGYSDSRLHLIRHFPCYMVCKIRVFIQGTGKMKKISRALTVSRSVDVPSIPSCGRPYGYHINEDGSITKRFPPAIDSTLGPAYYKPQFDFSNVTLKYKGIHFGNSLGRLELPIKSGPGPGQYDITQKKALHYENINIKKDQQQNHCSNLPRLYEVIILQEEKKKRFVPMKSITPAPGAYNESRTAFKLLKKTPGLKNTSFGQSAARFTQDSRTEKMPGPGFYNLQNNTLIDNFSNTCLKKQKKSAFGSSVPRTLFLVQKEVFPTPGPAGYKVIWNSQVCGISDELPNLTNRYAAFSSRTERTTKVSDMDVPAPGTYDVQKPYEMSQVQHKYMPPHSVVARIKHASFLSTTPRFLDKMNDGPGPATYNPVLKKSCSIPLFVKASKRFKDSKEITPGPATYEVCQ
ncbi:sperm-tail PG-rich repeat-containing protein 2 [Mesoplodon densirostris]|uniref:sperm-tail PG-rich repeat-containing protein 2 n=1 Tax=Mesoplodon densirostris TaxID=48708 RepID=UPI0028DB44E9|nr:sperm-tail PG-rich repeat-containing protein 2 [Mesoplodon densirostris]